MQSRANSVFGTKYEYQYYLCSEIWPIMKMYIFRVFFNQQNRNTIIIRVKKLTKYEYNLQIIIIILNTKTNNMSTKTIKSSNKY